jgi:hypothetical protein
MAQFVKTVIIANSETVSTAAYQDGGSLIGIRTPAALTGTEFTFQVSFEDQVFLDYKKPDGDPVAITVAVDGAYGILPTDFLSFDYIKVVSGSTEGSARIITLVFKKD